MNEASDTVTSEGLRARNRERTVQRLQQAAWDLVADQGFEAVTAEAVADRAEVSRRTFFNYYPRVELVLQERLRATIAELVERFVQRPADEGLHVSLPTILTDPFDAELLEKAVIIFGQQASSPAARFFVMEAQAAEVPQIAQALMDRGGPGTDPMYAQVVARATLDAGHIATVAWVDQSGGVVNDATRQLHLELLRQAFGHLFTAFSVPGALDPSPES